MIMGMQVSMAQVAVATLHHKDTVTIYSNSQLQGAIDKAVEGDTIYLSEGLFAGFSVGKNISIMGSGKATVISGQVTIYGSTSLLLCNMYIQDKLFFDNAKISGTRILQCIIGNMTFSHASVSDYSSIELIMSHITGTLDFTDGNSGSSINSITIVNTKINKVNRYGKNVAAATFVNCNISSFISQASDAFNSYQNCIIGTLPYGSFTNCLYSGGNNGTLTNCYKGDFTLDNDLNCSLTDAELKEKEYLGTDGTVVGVTGGNMPFTLESPILQVTEHSLDVDNVNKKLKITLKLGNK